MKEKFKMIKIEWMDVMSLDTALITKEDLIVEKVKPAAATIIGFLVHENDEAYFIAKELWESGQFKYIHVIPKKTAIIKVTLLQNDVIVEEDET